MAKFVYIAGGVVAGALGGAIGAVAGIKIAKGGIRCSR